MEIARRQLAPGVQLARQQACMALVQAQTSRYSDTVALFQALGGD